MVTVLFKLFMKLRIFLVIIKYKMLYPRQLKINDLSFRRGFSIVAKGDIYIGNNVFFNNYCSINAMESVIIGDDCIFGENVHIYDHNHVYTTINVPIRKSGYSSSPVIIGRNCWVGSNCIILKGVKIGDNCVIGSGVIVYDDIPSDTIVLNKQQHIQKKIIYKN